MGVIHHMTHGEFTVLNILNVLDRHRNHFAFYTLLYLTSDGFLGIGTLKNVTQIDNVPPRECDNVTWSYVKSWKWLTF